MRFESPWAFLLLVALPFLWSDLLPLLGNKKQARISFVAPAFLKDFGVSSQLQFRIIIKHAIASAVLILAVIALARPQTGNAYVEIRASGRDLVLLLDVSGSMDALDFGLDSKRVTRLEALKQVTKEFVSKRQGDRIGLILFGEHVFTQSPLTLDQRLILNFIDALEVGMAGDGTALGDSIAVALQRVESIKENSKVLILVTDGVRTAGRLNPVEAAELAAKLGVKIYTIGIGGSGPAPFAVDSLFGKQYQYRDTPLDEKSLKKIASLTGGAYFNAKSTEELAKVYKLLDQLEPREEIKNEYVEYKEQYFWFVLGAVLLLSIYIVLHYVFWIEVI